MRDTLFFDAGVNPAKIAEKPDFTNARVVRVCQKVISEIVQLYEEPYICRFLRKTGHGMEFP